MPAPRAIFEVTYPDREALLAKNCILAYHGSRLQNFHSILHNGLSPLFASEVCNGYYIFNKSQILYEAITGALCKYVRSVTSGLEMFISSRSTKIDLIKFTYLPSQ